MGFYPFQPSAGGGFTNPMTAAGDMIDGGTAGAAQRLPVGSANQVLTVVAGAPAWENAASGFTNPMTTLGDMIDGAAGGTAQRLAVGSAGQFLGVSAGSPAWEALPGATTGQAGVIQLDGTAGDIQPIGVQAAGAKGQAADSEHVHATPLTTAGDLLYFGASGLARLPVGSNGQFLSVVTGEPAWAAGGGLSRTFQFVNNGTTASIAQNALITGMSWELLAGALSAGTAFRISFGVIGGTITSVGLYKDTVSGTQGTGIYTTIGGGPTSSIFDVVCLASGSSGVLMVTQPAAAQAVQIAVNTTVNNFLEFFNTGAAGTFSQFQMTVDPL